MKEPGGLWSVPAVAQAIGVAGLFTTAFFAGFGNKLGGAGSALCLLAVLMSWRVFWQCVRIDAMFWLVATLVLYLIVRAYLAHREFPADDLSLGIKDIALASGVLGLLFAWWLNADPRRIHWVLSAALLGVLARVLSFFAFHRLLPDSRLYAGTSPNALGLYVATGLFGLIVFAPAWWRAVQCWPLALRIAASISWIAIVIGCFQILLMTESRSAWLALSLVLVATSIWYVSYRLRELSRVQRRKMVVLGMAIAAICSVLIYLNRGEVAERVTSTVAGTLVAAPGPLDIATSVRLDLWRLGARKFVERPMLGWGPNSSEMVVRRYAQPPANTFRDFHNLYLQMLVTIGLVGVLPALGIGLLLSYRAVRSLQAGLMPVNIGIFALGAMAIYLIASCFQIRYDDATGRVYTALLFAAAYTFWMHRPKRVDVTLSPSIAHP